MAELDARPTWRQRLRVLARRLECRLRGHNPLRWVEVSDVLEMLERAELRRLGRSVLGTGDQHFQALPREGETLPLRERCRRCGAWWR